MFVKVGKNVSEICAATEARIQTRGTGDLMLAVPLMSSTFM